MLSLCKFAAFFSWFHVGSIEKINHPPQTIVKDSKGVVGKNASRTRKEMRGIHTRKKRGVYTSSIYQKEKKKVESANASPFIGGRRALKESKKL